VLRINDFHLRNELVMSRRIVRVQAACCLLIAVLASGCGSEDRYPVRGQVTFEGKPMIGGGSITLVPLTDQEGRVAGGEIGPDGKYSLMTETPGDGSMPGEFRVMIYQVTEQEPATTEDGQKAAVAARVVPMEDRIPDIYFGPDSPLRMKVEAKSLNEINFDLKRN
jgi:hypothetical protein